MIIRTLTEQDAAAFQALRLKGLKEAPTAFSSSFEEEQPRSLDSVRERFRTAFSTPSNQVFGAFDGEQLVGMAGILSDGRVKTGHKATIWGVFIDAAGRGQGLGRRLIETAVTAARSMPGVTAVHLSVESSNDVAKRLYLSLGFKCWGTEPKALLIAGRWYDEDQMYMEL